MSFTPPTVTGYSGYYDPLYGRAGNGAAADYNNTLRYGRSSTERRAALALSRSGFRGMRRAMRVLNGAAPGSDATENYTRVGVVDQNGPNSIGPGGLRTMETVVANSGNTTTAQQTYINNNIIDLVFATSPSIPYPADLSGNGSGGKLGV
jgi:hypothetical protein